MKKIFIIFLIIFIFKPLIADASLGCFDYGVGAYETLSGNCACRSGYTWGTDLLGEPYCITMYSYCQDKLGFNSSYNSLTGNCECWSGYLIGEDLFGEPKCISGNSWCQDKLGYHSSYSSLKDTCVCNSGYELSQKITGGLTCLSCFQKYGSHSSYDYILKQCECDDDYTLVDGECVEKQNNVYFYLKELDTYDKQAIIKSNYDYHYYLINYGIGCYSSSFEYYLHNNIVVNLGTDFDVDIFDFIVLYDHDETCDILRVERVDSDFSIIEEESYIPPIDYKLLSNNLILSKNNQVSTDNDVEKNDFIEEENDIIENKKVTDQENNSNTTAEDSEIKNEDDSDVLLQDKDSIVDNFTQDNIVQKIEDIDDRKNNTEETTDNIITGMIFLVLVGFGFLFYRFLRTG